MRVQRYNLTQSVRRLGEQRQQLQYSNKQKDQQLNKLLTEHWRCLERQNDLEKSWLNCHDQIQSLVEDTRTISQTISRLIQDSACHQQEMTELTINIKKISPDFK